MGKTIEYKPCPIIRISQEKKEFTEKIITCLNEIKEAKYIRKKEAKYIREKKDEEPVKLGESFFKEFQKRKLDITIKPGPNKCVATKRDDAYTVLAQAIRVEESRGQSNETKVAKKNDKIFQYALHSSLSRIGMNAIASQLAQSMTPASYSTKDNQSEFFYLDRYSFAALEKSGVPNDIIRLLKNKIQPKSYENFPISEFGEIKFLKKLKKQCPISLKREYRSIVLDVARGFRPIAKPPKKAIKSFGAIRAFYKEKATEVLNGMRKGNPTLSALKTEWGKDTWQKWFYDLQRILRPYLDPGTGTACYVFINIDAKINPNDKNPAFRFRPLSIALAHEMVHAYRAVHGRMLYVFERFPGLSSYDIEEIIVVGIYPYHQEEYSENRFRAAYKSMGKVGGVSMKPLAYRLDYR